MKRQSKTGQAWRLQQNQNLLESTSTEAQALEFSKHITESLNRETWLDLSRQYLPSDDETYSKVRNLLGL